MQRSTALTFQSFHVTFLSYNSCKSLQLHKEPQYWGSASVIVGFASPSLKTQWPRLDLLPASVTAGSGTTFFKVRNDLSASETLDVLA